MRTTLCVRYPPETVACGAIYLAARLLLTPLPNSPPWWEVFDCTKTQMDEVSSLLSDLYTRDVAQYTPVSEEDPATEILCPAVATIDSASTEDTPKEESQKGAVGQRKADSGESKQRSEGTRRDESPHRNRSSGSRSQSRGSRSRNRNRSRSRSRSRDHRSRSRRRSRSREYSDKDVTKQRGRGNGERYGSRRSRSREYHRGHRR